MKIEKLLLLFIIFISSINGFSQSVLLDPIIDTCAASGILVYDTGEVFVVYNIQGEQIVSKSPDESKDDGLTDKLLGHNISVYPNPVNHILTIKTPDGYKVHRIQLYSVDGKMVIDKEIENNQIDLTNLLRGSYILKTDFDTNTTFKIIKQ